MWMPELLLAFSSAPVLISGLSTCYGRLVVCAPAALAFPAAGGAIVTLSEPSAALPSLAGLRPSVEPWLLELAEELVGSFLLSVEPGFLLLLSELTPSLEPWLLVLEEGLVGSFLPSIDPFLLLFTSGLVGVVFPSAELSLLFLPPSNLPVASRLVMPCELFVGSSEPGLVAVTASELPLELLVGSSSFLLVAVVASVFEGVLEDEALSSFT